MVEIEVTGDKKLIAALESLTSKELKSTIKKSLSRAGTKLKGETIKNLKGVTSRYNVKGSKTIDGKEKLPLIKGITNKVWKNNGGVTVTIMGDYRLKWFENGTVERHIYGRKHNYKRRKYKVIANRGQMKEAHFFANAVSARKDEVMNDFQDELEKQIRKNYIQNK
jgi:hypothetical protein